MPPRQEALSIFQVSFRQKAPEKSGNSQIFQMIHDPGVLTRGMSTSAGISRRWLWSVSFRNLPHHCFEQNSALTLRAYHEQDETFVAFEN